MILFRGTQLASLTDDKPVRLVIEGFKDPNERLFLNELSGEVQPNFQLLYAIGPGKYIDSFAQRLAPFVITGTHILTTCTGQQVQAQTQPTFLTFYQANNIVARAAGKKGPLLISFNGIVLKSYLVKLVIGSYQKEGVDGHQFQLHVLAEMSDPTDNAELSKADAFDKELADKIAAFERELAAQEAAFHASVASGPGGRYT
jgi:hypothetical protein